MNNFEKKEFDAFAKDYRNILKENIKSLSEFGSEYFAEYKVQKVNEDLNYTPKRILDFGCGDGISCEYFRKYFKDSDVVGIDVSSESIKVAKDKNIPNASFFVLEKEHLPFEDESFDLIFVACVFHHIEKDKHIQILKEFKRVLKNGAKAFIFEHNPLNPLTRKLVKDCIFDKDANLIYANSMKKIFPEAGFKNAKINYTLFFPRYNLFKKCFRLEKHFKKCPLGAQYYIEAIKAD